ncbi:MAG: tryptophan--tRNA ligase [Oscillospiraceae bacterium]|nr:tryptophan--tRNA ligase [Oscillospiraceae bacterium]
MKTCFSAIQPTGIPTLGNYLGALRNWVNLSREYTGIFSIADLHAITVRQDPGDFRRRVRAVYAICMASGLDFKNGAVLFPQSQVAAHTELTWILSCFTMYGELSRMTQFKDKSLKNSDNINSGLFTYPILMASDILLYGAAAVPVGSDQKQHVELTRDIAVRFNGVYGDVFVLPEPFIPDMGARVMNLQDPKRKMEKSDPNPNGYISMLDDREAIIKKCKRAVTDSGGEVRYDEKLKPGISNLMTIYSLCAGKSLEETEREFSGQNYGTFKTAVGEAVNTALAPIRDCANEYIGNPAHLDKLMNEQTRRATELAAPMLKQVKNAMGFVAD